MLINQPYSILQRREMGIVHHVGYREHTNTLFLMFNCLKFVYLVMSKTAQIVYKANNLDVNYRPHRWADRHFCLPRDFAFFPRNEPTLGCQLQDHL